MRKIMDAVQHWIEKNMVPVMNWITARYWFGIVSDAVLYVVPFCMVSAIPSLWTVLRNFVPELPDIRAWCAARERNYRRERGSFGELFRLRRLNPSTTLFEAATTRLPSAS